MGDCDLAEHLTITWLAAHMAFVVHTLLVFPPFLLVVCVPQLRGDSWLNKLLHLSQSLIVLHTAALISFEVVSQGLSLLKEPLSCL